MKTNPKILLKIPEGLIRKANERRVLDDIIFYYKLKSLTIEGSFKKQSLVKLIQSKFQISESSIWRKVKRLVELGYLIKSKGGYSLIGYDILFRLLNYDLSIQTKYKNMFGDIYRYNRLGNFKIFKLSVKCLKEFVNYVAYDEIKLNFQRQQYSVCRDDLSSVLIPKKKLNYHQYIDKLLQMKLQSHYIRVKMKRQFIKFVNIDITLSCEGISRLLGFLSSRSGYLIEKNLVRLGLISIQKRFVLYEANPFLFKQLGIKCDNLVYKQSFVYYNLPNKIFLLI